MDNDTDPDLGEPLELPGQEKRSHYPSMQKPPRKWPKKLLVIILGIVIVAGLIFGAWQLFGKKKTNKTTPQPANVANPSSPQVSDVPDSTVTKTYQNDTLALQLTYPSTWTVTESTQKDGVRLESPNFTYKTVAGTTTNGNFRIYIRKGARDIDSKYIGRGVAIQSSEKLAYTKPASGQRTDTLLSLFGLDTPDNFAYFLVAGNFQLKKGDTLGPNYGKESGTFIVTGGYSSQDLKDDMATNPVPTDSFQQTKAYQQATGILTSLQLQ